MNLQERLDFFNSNYGICPLHIGRGKKFYIGSKDNKHCRFCGRNEPEVKFRNIAHAVPEFLGNKQLISLQECDECNDFFARNLEDHLGKYTKPFRLISMIKGKRGIPAYKTKGKESRIEFDLEEGSLVSSETVNERISSIDFKNDQLTLEFDYEPYIPVAVYKAFVKIGLSVIHEDELAPFQKTIKWILNSDHSKGIMKPLAVKVLFMPGINPHKFLKVYFLRKKIGLDNERIPYCMLIVCFGNFSCQLMVPSSNDFKDKKTINFELPYFPTEFELDGAKNLKAFAWDLTSHKVVKGKKETIKFNYGSIEPISE